MSAACAQQFPSNNLLTNLNLGKKGYTSNIARRVKRQMEINGRGGEKEDRNSNEIAIQCRNVRETKKPERFSRADGCNKLNSVLFSCIFTLLATKKRKKIVHTRALTKRKEEKGRA